MKDAAFFKTGTKMMQRRFGKKLQSRFLGKRDQCMVVLPSR